MSIFTPEANIIIKEAKPEDAAKLIEYTKLVGAQTDNLSFGKEGIGDTLEVEKEFINERDALWCFIIYDYVSKRYSICLFRKTMPEMDKEYAGHHDTLSWKPIYGLGFKLKEN